MNKEIEKYSEVILDTFENIFNLDYILGIYSNSDELNNLNSLNWNDLKKDWSLFLPLMKDIKLSFKKIKHLKHLKVITDKYYHSFQKYNDISSQWYTLLWFTAIFTWSLCKRPKNISELKQIISKFSQPLKKQEFIDTILDSRVINIKKSRLAWIKNFAINGFELIFDALKMYKLNFEGQLIKEHEKLLFITLFIALNIDDGLIIDKIGYTNFVTFSEKAVSTLSIAKRGIINAKESIKKIRQFMIEKQLFPLQSLHMTIGVLFLININLDNN